MSNVINFDDHAADLHLSEWAAFITDVSADFAKVAAAHEAHPTPATKDGCA